MLSLLKSSSLHTQDGANWVCIKHVECSAAGLNFQTDIQRCHGRQRML